MAVAAKELRAAWVVPLQGCGVIPEKGRASTEGCVVGGEVGLEHEGWDVEDAVVPDGAAELCMILVSVGSDVRIV